ncbi:Alpha/Beta hydrolase protein [Syncephalastrum racemosum]|uniref:Alpha/Beta hydrolase protein n=1 Tax=Syncephalastrum racemosum TaxID=13706 RepID=A0A1X2HGS5_SYNRA|nr:Alpha/Beta hydrolase protein [Syncephalastrum racemosum]
MTSDQPAVHPLYAEHLAKLKDIPVQDLSLLEMRQAAEAIFKYDSLPEVHLQEVNINSSDGREVELTIARPLDTENVSLPVLLFIHGGGFSVCSKHTHAVYMHELCVRARIGVVFVSYGLAPEVKYPGGLEDCYAALQWIVSQGKSYHLDANKVAVAGDSSGGNMSAALTYLTKERGCGHLLNAQILFNPLTSMMTQHYASYDQFGKNNDYSLSSNSVKNCVDRYINDASELNDKLVTPQVATLEDMQGLPPALVITAECDMLRDEGEEYSRKLTEAGVDCTAVRFIGAIHGFVMLSAKTPQREMALNLMARYLKDIFSETMK